MATRNPIVPAVPGAQSCDYCHQKPKFSNHSYCSKTCATQAATLCNHCHKKPKFQNFDYCGKNCATLANPGGAKAGGGARPPQGNNAQSKPAPAQRGQFQQQQQKAAFDPLQIAKLVAQQIPQVQALLAANGLASTIQQQQQPAQQPVNNQYAQQPAPATHRSTNSNPSNPVNNPFMNTMNPAMASMPQPGHSNTGLAQNSFQQPQFQQPVNTDDLDCLIPGCGKPVHIDAKGLKTSDYCSQRHREEAVTSGLVSPCIMCLTRPQSHTDYFCGRTCREESLNKRYDAAEPSRVEEVEEQDEGLLADHNGDGTGQYLN
ncbi:hypothetical protein BKA70DRAFT_1525790 [Coprinopsis sp. MPI-PUGE-AT-0042]|nr:hypothetical protein BKA70DRAFT_1525790 [Coprinopsis sp. MPI-PUGE-AT-0042]